MVEEKLYIWTPTLHCVRLNFDECFLGYPRPLQIGLRFMNHHGTVVRAFSKHARVGIAMEAKYFVERLKANQISGFIQSSNKERFSCHPILAE